MLSITLASCSTVPRSEAGGFTGWHGDDVMSLQGAGAYRGAATAGRAPPVEVSTTAILVAAVRAGVNRCGSPARCVRASELYEGAG